MSIPAAKAPMPAVTVFMPVYNARRYLREAIESILSQTLENFELLVIDDGSTDDSAEIVGSYADDRIRLLHNPRNLGLAGVANRGFAEARGRYVARMDADDVAEPERLAEQVAFLDQHPEVTVLATWVRLVDEDGAVYSQSQPSADPSVLAWELSGWCAICHPSIMLRAKPLQRLGGFMDWACPAEDYDLWTRGIQAGERVAVLPKHLLRYRSHPAQSGVAQREKQHAAMRKVAQRYVSWLLSEEISDEQMRSLMALRRGINLDSHPDLSAPIALARRLALACETRIALGSKSRVVDVAADALVYGAAEALAQGYPAQARQALMAALSWRPARILRPRTLRMLLATCSRATPPSNGRSTSAPGTDAG